MNRTDSLLLQGMCPFVLIRMEKNARQQQNNRCIMLRDINLYVTYNLVIKIHLLFKERS